MGTFFDELMSWFHCFTWISSSLPKSLLLITTPYTKYTKSNCRLPSNTTSIAPLQRYLRDLEIPSMYCLLPIPPSLHASFNFSMQYAISKSFKFILCFRLFSHISPYILTAISLSFSNCLFSFLFVIAYLLMLIEFLIICSTVDFDLIFGFSTTSFRWRGWWCGFKSWWLRLWGWLPRLQLGWEALILVVWGLFVGL